MVTESRLPQLTMKIWDGDPRERFRALDMNRICYNANVVAGACGVRTAQFPEVGRADQFDYTYANIIEEIVRDCADVLRMDLRTDTSWGPGRSFSYTDPERWESNLHALYTALGGIGDRIPAELRRLTYSATLFSGDWVGHGPWYQDLVMPVAREGREMVAFVPHTATPLQRASEASALLRVETRGRGTVRVTAEGTRPRTNIPMRLALGGLDMQETRTLTAGGWTGSGPWYQDVVLGAEAVDAIMGATEGTTGEQLNEMAYAGLVPSAVSGSTVTVMAMYARPSADITVGFMYDTEEAA